MSEPTLEDLIFESRELKDAIERYTDQIAPLKEQRDAINETILARMGEEGLTTMQTPAAAVSISERTFARIAGDGRQDFMAWLSQHPEGMALLGNQLSGEALTEYETLAGELPPGAAYHRTTTLAMRRRN